MLATVHPTPAALGQACEVVFTVITSSEDVEAVALGKQGLIEGMTPGSVPTNATAASAHFAQRLYSDQPVSAPGVWNLSDLRPLEGIGRVVHLSASQAAVASPPVSTPPVSTSPVSPPPVSTPAPAAPAAKPATKPADPYASPARKSEPVRPAVPSTPAITRPPGTGRPLPLP